MASAGIGWGVEVGGTVGEEGRVVLLPQATSANRRAKPNTHSVILLLKVFVASAIVTNMGNAPKN
jgi:hypothetical protein